MAMEDVQHQAIRALQEANTFFSFHLLSIKPEVERLEYLQSSLRRTLIQKRTLVERLEAALRDVDRRRDELTSGQISLFE